MNLKARHLYKTYAWYRKPVRWFYHVKVPLLGGVGLIQVVRFFIKQMQNEPLGMRASAIAFNLFLALFPSLIALLTLIPYVPVNNLSPEVLSFIQKLMPAAAADSIESILGDVLSTNTRGLFSIGLISAIYFASNGLYSLMAALNKFNSRSFWQQKFLSIQLTFIIGFLVISAISLFILTEFGLQLLAIKAPWGGEIWYITIIVLQWVVLLIILFGACILCFRFAMDKNNAWHEIVPGAVVASVLSMITSILYSYYVSSFANYSRTYGSLGTIIITMLWLYFNSTVIIIGSDLNLSLVRAAKIKARHKNARIK